ncbi:MAG: metN [Acidobacteria bacterium]|jgi:phospholipid/cholesterol/gamma-HCH transport system ATP-binding protein|nr:metN [Acidobacteriota bacterium]
MIEFRNVTKSFEDEVVLRNVSFRIRRGETKIILGVSGSGKSTILKLILGLIRPDSGQIIFEDQDITLLSEQELVGVRKKIGMVFQEGALFDSLDVRENVGYRLYEDGSMPDEEIGQVVLRLLSFVGLEDAIDKMPAELSGGMKRRVGIARALVGTPRLVLYDEPTAGLDPITKRTIVDLMIKLRDVEGVTTVFVTHDLQAAATVASEYAETAPDGRIVFRRGGDNLCLLNVECIMLEDGHISFEGRYEDLMSSQLPFVRTFVA